MKVSYDWLSTYFPKGFLKRGLPRPAQVAEMLTAHAFEVEGIEKVSGDTVFDVKVLPDRAHYALSHAGIAGEVSAISRKPLAPSAESARIVADQSVARPKVSISDPALCLRYMARRIDGVTIGTSPKRVAKRLEAIGQRSINSVVDATNYLMYGVGQPLHAFDADKVRGQIVVRLAKEGEKIVVLDGRELALLPTDLVIADDLGAIAIAGVKGGKRAEVTAETKNVIIESANFNPASVRRTSTRLNLRSDSSKRFENEISPVMTASAIDGVTRLLLETSPEARVGETVDIYPTPAREWTVTVDPKYMNAVTGLNLTAAEMKDILARLECAVKEQGDKLVVTPHFSRLDIRIPEDVADELIRLYGYDKLASAMPPEVPRVPVDKTYYYAEKVKNILVEQGFSELQTYSLVPKGHYEVAYPLASDKKALRESLEEKIIHTINRNFGSIDMLGSQTIKVFEIGQVFPKAGEKTSLCIGFIGPKKKGVAERSYIENEVLPILAKGLGIENILNQLKSKDTGLTVGNIVNMGKMAGSVIEIDFTALLSRLPKPGPLSDLGFKPLSSDISYKPFSPYPYIVRDIALFVPAMTSESEVEKTISDALAKSAGKLLVKGPACFDRFEKDGRKSLAFRMIFQSFDRTLSDEETNKYMEAAYAAVKGKGWEVR